MILLINSDNPQFSYCINKNPNSLPKVSTTRQGVSIGFFTNVGYAVTFIDGPDEISYKKYAHQEFEYLDKQKFCSPMAYYNALDFFKLSSSYDGDYCNSATLSSIKIRDRLKEVFRVLFPEFSIKYTEIYGGYDEVYITYRGELQKLVDFLRIYTLFVSLDEEDHYFDEEFILSNLERLVSVDAPYFLRYLFKTNLLNKSLFLRVKEKLQQSSQQLEFVPQNNQQARISFILDNINKSVVDFGCGDGDHAGPITNKGFDYFGYDRDQSCIEFCKNRRRGEFGTLSEIPFDEYDIVLAEVIEHNTPEDLQNIVDFINNDPRISRALITTPNFSFNQFYPGDGLRHDDHQFEWTLEQFNSWLSSNFSEYSIYPIGDQVNGIPVSYGAIINVKNNQS